MDAIKKLFLQNRFYFYVAAGAFVALSLFFIAFAGKKDGLPPAALPQQHDERAGDVAGYMRDCVDGVLKSDAVPESCRSAEAAEKTYGVDIWFLLAAEHARAMDTAQRIVSGRIMKEKDYRACVKAGTCSLLPLPRSGKTPEQREEIFLFLQELSGGRRIDPRICAFLDICRALVKTGLYDPSAQKEE